jgi:PAS domain S-box-containing protein
MEKLYNTIKNIRMIIINKGSFNLLFFLVFCPIVVSGNPTSSIVLHESTISGMLHFLLTTVTGLLLLGLFHFMLITLIYLYVRRITIRYRKRFEKIEREREEILNEIINSQPAAIYRVVVKKPYEHTPDGMPVIQYDYISGQHEQITGLSSEELKGNPMEILNRVHIDDRQGFIDENAGSVKDFRSFKWEGRVVVRGEIKWLRIESNPKALANGDILWSGIIVDNTRQRVMEDDLSHRKDFERLVSEISGEFLNIQFHEFDQIIEYTLGKLGDFCKIDRAYLFLWDQSKDTVSNTHEWCIEEIEPQKPNLQNLPCNELSMWMSHLKSPQPLTIEKVEEMDDNWHNEREILRSQGIKSVAVVPVIANNVFIGFVGFDSVNNHRVWKDYEIQLLNVYASLIYNAFDKRRSDMQLLESRQMLRTVLDTINVRVFWKDIDLRFMGCNKAFAFDAHVDSPEEVVGKTDFQMPWKHEAEKYRASDLEVIRSGEPIYDLVELTSFDGKQVDFKRTTKIPLRDMNGKVIGILGTSQNITPQKLAEKALRESEQKYRILTENAFDGIYLLGFRSFKYVNQRFCEMTGYSYDELINPGFDASIMIGDESREVYRSRRQARLEGREVPRTYEIRLKSKSGKLIDVEISTTPLGYGENIQILGVVRDITERKNNEKLLREVSIAKQSVQFKQNFLANMSHEIRTPLTGVLGMIELLAKTDLDPQQQDFINTLKLSTENLREIINQILDYSKIEAGQVKLRRDIFNKGSILKNAQKLFETICNKDIKLETNIDPKLPDYILADEQRVIQVIYNLLSNAVKFTFKGKITIDAHLNKWIDDDKFLIEVKVSDTGIGIREEFLPSLFLPFEQYDHQNNLYFEGTGLGLTICKELVELMGGEISVESVEGKGTTFTFSFLAGKVEKTDAEKKEIAHQKRTKRINLRILYAEDKIVNQKVVSLMLKSLGHEVVLAANGQEAIDKYRQGLFDLILMDIQMPVMNGIEATQKLKKYYSDLPPVVGLSANAFEGDRQKYIELGMDEYLTKPVKADDFTSMISKLF